MISGQSTHFSPLKSFAFASNTRFQRRSSRSGTFNAVRTDFRAEAVKEIRPCESESQWTVGKTRDHGTMALEGGGIGEVVERELKMATDGILGWMTLDVPFYIYIERRSSESSEQPSITALPRTKLASHNSIRKNQKSTLTQTRLREVAGRIYNTSLCWVPPNELDVY